MKIKLDEVPFSASGSYMALSVLSENFHKWNNPEGLYLRSVHGIEGNSLGIQSVAARIIPTYCGNAIDCNIYATAEAMTIETAHGNVTAAFDDENTLLFDGEGDHLGLEFIFGPIAKDNQFNLVEQWQDGERPWYLTYVFHSTRRYMAFFQEGDAKVSQDWDGESAKDVKWTIEAVDGHFLLAVEEVFGSWKDKGKKYHIEEAKAVQRASFEKFVHSMPEIPETYKEAGEFAAYVNWSSIVNPAGLVKRCAMYMSKNWMGSIWSWDHCFNAWASAYGNPDMAWDQFMVMFDHQRPNGQIPDSINDVILLEDYCKPPIHGWIYGKMKKLFDISDERKAEAYEKIGKWTNWWLDYRDINQDGLCEYAHGNDSGWDNSTPFIEGGPMTLPDLQAFLVIQMEELSSIAAELEKKDESEIWQNKADQMFEKMLAKLFRDGKPVAVHSFSGEVVETKSLLLYLPILLGKRLPEDIRKNLIEGLKSFRTEYGYATERTDSLIYTPDGYWRGPIWAPSSMIIIDGLEACGEHEMALEAAKDFCDMCAKSGCAENFDALTGEGLRDRAYTWTASVMLVLTHEYLMSEAGK